MLWRWGGLIIIVSFLAACGTRQPPVIIDRSLSGAATHTVVAGDTLYSIALRYDRDYRELARINGLGSDYLIKPGQRLRLNEDMSAAKTRVSVKTTAPPAISKPVVTTKQEAKPAAVAVVSKPLPPVNPQTKSASNAQGGTPIGSSSTAKSVAVIPEAKAPESRTTETRTLVEKKPVTPVELPAATRGVSPLAWSWPAKGSVLGSFGGSGLAGKGIDIAGKRGDPVVAAAAGTIVYAGAGLVGYGKLLIVRHDDAYISAYAYNDKFLVAEGDSVRAGQTIAEMGSSGTDRDKLHFEIRERGKPVDPLRFLPNR